MRLYICSNLTDEILINDFEWIPRIGDRLDLYTIGIKNTSMEFDYANIERLRDPIITEVIWSKDDKGYYLWLNTEFKEG